MKSPEEKLKEFKNVSHDIQNILSTIVNNAQLLKKDIIQNSSAEKLLKVIENNSLRASEIIQEFLSDKKTQKRKIDTEILFNDVVSSFENTIPPNIIFEHIKSDPLPIIFGNYTDLYRAIFNVLINAKEAIIEKGKIIFEANSQEEGKLYLSINDNGNGITVNNLEKIFMSGFSTKNKGRESGMGLDIVKNIIEDHNGLVELSSDINKGTEFKIVLPVFKAKESTVNNKIILIADDDNSLRESLADLFESYGYKTLQAKNGDEVLNFIENKTEIDLLIIDKKMPKKDGIECIIELRKVRNSLPIILVTGVNLDLDELENLESNNGVDKIILKPYDFIYLQNIVESILL